jgi:hypothetical protein
MDLRRRLFPLFGCAKNHRRKTNNHARIQSDMSPPDLPKSANPSGVQQRLQLARRTAPDRIWKTPAARQRRRESLLPQASRAIEAAGKIFSVLSGSSLFSVE